MKLSCLLLNIHNTSGYGVAVGVIQFLVPLIQNERQSHLNKDDIILSIATIKVALLNLQHHQNLQNQEVC